MAPLVVRQASFSGGLVDESYWGRTDTPRYPRALRQCVNWIPTAQGALQNRTGFQFLAKANQTGNVAPRLLPFIYSDSQSYVLEVSFTTVRWYSYGAPVYHPSFPTLLQIACPFYPDTEPSPYSHPLKFTQVGDVMKLVSYNAGASVTLGGVAHMALYELQRTAGNNFVLNTVPYVPHPYYFAAGLEPALRTEEIQPDTTDHPAKEWYYLVTQLLYNSLTGQAWETQPYRITQQMNDSNVRTAAPAGDLIVVYPDSKQSVRWGDPTASLPANTILVATRIYKGRGTMAGRIGETSQLSFTDWGYDPDLSVSPPQGASPLDVYPVLANGLAGGTPLGNILPQVITVFEERLVLANFLGLGVSDRPAEIRFSQIGDHNDFDRKAVPLDDTAMDITLASAKREEVRWLRGIGPELLAGTNSSVYAIGSGDGSALTPSNVAAHAQTDVGSLWVDPVVAGDFLLYARAKGTGIRGLRFSQLQQGYSGEDISIHVKLLFEGRTVLDMAWCEDPLGILWVLLDDGTLLSCTFQPETQTVAWAQHAVDGVVGSICSVPEGNADVLYATIQRNNPVDGSFWTVERMLPREANVFMDAAIIFAGDPTTVFAVPHLKSREVLAVADGNLVESDSEGNPLAADASGNVTLPYAASDVTIGLRVTADAELLDVAEARTRQQRVKRARVEIVETRGLKTGETFDELQEYQQREVEDDENPVPAETTTVDVAIESDWNVGGRVCLRQDVPFSSTIVGVTRMSDVGGDANG